ncbi:MAG: DUF1080 domain-containing protein [Proteobacteria bacterium]|nr:DUF1080 domain-containing protein [Pseudomonadota bacterium]MDA1063851.1 DUF1080 domain-containing protein [Pseudomonadota bacterium]
MKLKVSSVFPAVALLLAATASAEESPPRGFADPILGRWDLTVQGPGGEYPSWVEIRLRKETELMADFVGQSGSKRHATTVSFADDRLQVRIPLQWEQWGEGELIFDGMLEGDRLSGQTRIGDCESFTWTGVRAPSLAHTEVGKWDEPVDLIGAGLSGWRPRSPNHAGCWTVASGILSATPPCVDLVTEARFDDFRLQLEFRYPPGSNSGVYLRGRYEVQIQDDRGMAVDSLRIGGLYGFIAPRTNAAARPNDWQSMHIELIGRRISIKLNGIEVISQHEIPGITGGALDSDEESAGPLMLQGDHGPIEFRNIVITPGS